MSFKRAFKCNKCPESNSPEGCPCWTELTMVNDGGDHKIDKRCLFQMLPMLMVEVIKASNVSSEHSSVVKNQLADGFSKLAYQVNYLPALKEL